MYDKIRHKPSKGLPEDDEHEMFAHLIEDSSGDEDRMAREVPEVRPADWIDPQERRVEQESALQRAFDWLGGGEQRPGNPFADTREARPQEPEEPEERTFDELDVRHDRHTLRALVDPDTHTLKAFVRKADGKPYRFAQHEAIRSARLYAGPLHLVDLRPGETVQSPWQPSKAKLQGWRHPLTPRNPETLKVLTERQYEAFVWCYQYGLRNDQAAEKMGVKPDTIKEYLYFGRRRLEEATSVKIKGRRRGAAALGDSALQDVA
jgi:hypothetical protein